MPDSQIELEILRALQQLKGDLGRLEEGNKQLTLTIETVRESVTKTREEMIAVATKTGDLQRIEEKIDALHRRMDEAETTIRDNTLWIRGKQEEDQKRADRLADGFYGLGFGWLAQWIPAIALFAYLGWQNFHRTPAPQQLPPAENKTDG